MLQPDQHPENPQTKRRLLGLLEVSGLLDRLVRIKPRLATLKEVTNYHTSDYVKRVRELSAGVGGDAGEFTPIGTGSYEIALLSAGGALGGLHAVMKRQVRDVYRPVQPPGPPAEKKRAPGFSVFSHKVPGNQRAQP